MVLIWLKQIKNRIVNNKIESVIFFGALLIGTIAALFFYKQGMLAILVDENGHLNIARQVIDSMTPGFSQLGLWPPLLHLIMIPFIWNDFLWHSGFAGSVNIIFYAISCVFIYKTIKLFSKDNLPAILSVLVFGLNPYVIYFSTVAMMEILFLMNFIIATYYFIKWMKNDNLFGLIICAFFTTLTCLTRYEGFFLPIVFGGIILIKYLLSRKKYSQIEAITIIFGVLSTFGIFLTLLYSTIFAGSPFAFISGEWSAYAQQHESGYILSAEGNMFNAFLCMFSAAKYMIGYGLILLSFIVFVFFIIFAKRTFLKFLTLLILLIPFMFHVISLFRGNSIVYTPDFLYGSINIRYGLPLILFGSIGLGMFLTFNIKNEKMNNIFKYFFSILIIIISVNFLIFNLGYDHKNFVITQEVKDYPSRYMIQSAKIFNSEYDGGKLLMTRALNDFFIKNSRINIFDTIHESNDVYWQQTLKEPWLFARWILTFNPDSSRGWETKRDEIFIKWSSNDKIYELYDIFLKNDIYILLKINEDAMMDFAKKNNLDISEMPSMNTDIEYWDPEDIKDKIENKI